MQNGWGGGPSASQGATSLTQWPPAAPAGVIGGRGRGFVPGMAGRDEAWALGHYFNFRATGFICPTTFLQWEEQCQTAKP